MPLIERSLRAKLRFIANPADLFETPPKPPLTGVDLGRAQRDAFRNFMKTRKKR